MVDNLAHHAKGGAHVVCRWDGVFGLGSPSPKRI